MVVCQQLGVVRPSGWCESASWGVSSEGAAASGSVEGVDAWCKGVMASHLQGRSRLTSQPATKGSSRGSNSRTNDRHVLAAAIRAGSGVIVSENMKDDPIAAPQPHNIEPQTPGTLRPGSSR